MSVEFPCEACGQVLRVSSRAAGKPARCPKCQHVMNVPAPGLRPSAERPTAPLPPKPLPPDTAGEVGETPYATSAPAWSPRNKGPFSPNKIRNIQVGFEPIFSYAWERFKANLGLLVAALLVVLAIRFALSYGAGMLVGIVRGLRQPQLARLLHTATSLLDMVVGIYLVIGMVQMCLNIARRRDADLSDLFGGGPRLLPTIGISLLMGLIVTLGFIMLIVPGFLFLLMWWPTYYLVIDNQVSVVESFSMAAEVTDGNKLTAIVLALISLALTLAGFLACVVGMLFTMPLVTMLWCVAYLMMSGQIPAGE